MNHSSDSQLLLRYAESHSEADFTELVGRHVDFVHSAAVRMVCDPHLAEDVTQGVFVALAKNTAQLAERPAISGWLHRTAQNIAAQTVRTNVRRRAREQEAVAMNELIASSPDASWEHIAPHLDAALGELGDADRDAVLLRYFEKKSAREMAAQLGMSDEAAQKRVSRAVEKLREFFAKRGVTIGASGLAVVISANAVQAAPVGLALTISAAALAGTTVTTSTVITATKTIAMTTLQKTIVTATIAALAGAGIYEARQTSQLRDKNQILQQTQASLTERLKQFQSEREEAGRQIATLRDDNERLNRNTGELLKLRNEITQLRPLRHQVAELQKLTAQSASGLTEWRPNQLVNVGRATPQEALQTFFWSSMTTNITEIRNSLIGDPNDPPTEAAIQEFVNNGANQQVSEGVAKIRVLSQSLNTADEAQLEIHMQFDQSDSLLNAGSGMSGLIRLRKVNGEWKFVLANTHDQNGKVIGVDLVNKPLER